jgi:hypothetical protein
MKINRRYIALAILIFIFTGLFFRYLHRAPKRHYCDFKVYHATAQRFIAKEDIYDRPDEAITPFKYSPMFAVLVSPLAFFSRKTASLIFFTVNFILLIVIFVISKKIIVRESISFKERAFSYILPAIFTSRFILQVLDSGQVNIIILTLIVCGLYFLYKKKDILAAAFIGLSVMFKYMPILFLPYFIFRKKIKFAIFTMIFIVLYCLLPAFYVGWERELNYLKKWLPFISETSLDKGSLYDYKNQSLYSLGVRYFSYDYPHKVSFVNLTFIQGLMVGGIIGIIIYLLVLFPRLNNGFHSPIEYSLLLLGTALLNPNAWTANFVVFIFAYMTIFYYLFRVKFKDKLTLFLVILSFMLASWSVQELLGEDLDILIAKLSSVTVGALLLVLVLLRLKFKKTFVLFNT